MREAIERVLRINLGARRGEALLVLGDRINRERE